MTKKKNDQAEKEEGKNTMDKTRSKSTQNDEARKKKTHSMS